MTNKRPTLKKTVSADSIAQAGTRIGRHAIPVTLADVRSAHAAISGAIEVTPFTPSRTLGEMLGCAIYLKFENLQYTASFKERGALNRLLSLTPEERRRGVIAVSAGNHAQGVAYHASRLDIPATIVMPEATPAIKIKGTRSFGATVILSGTSLEAASLHADAYGASHGLTPIPPFDDAAVIAGQGTLALEMLAAVPDLDVIVVPIGGGGLISGIAVAAKALKPDIGIIGVEARLYPGAYNLVKGLSLPTGGDTLAEGIAVKTPGRLTLPIIRALVDDIVLVSEADLERAVSRLIAIEKTVAEGAGAAGLAAVIADPIRFKGLRVGLILCGGNIDTRLLASVLTREEARQGRLSRLAIDVPDRPGQLAAVATIIGAAGANIVEVYHQRVFTDVPAKGTELNLVIETRDREHLAATITSLRAAGYQVVMKAAG